MIAVALASFAGSVTYLAAKKVIRERRLKRKLKARLGKI